MRVKKLGSNKEILIRAHKYLINWDKSGNSSLERQFRELIKPYWLRCVVLFQCTIPGSKLKIDFLNCNKRLAVEINGPQHDKFNKFFHNGSLNVFKDAMRRDLQKQRWLEENNIILLELIQEDLDNFSPRIIEQKYGIDIT
jgi:very-short-patch-repair endonuclease